MAEPLSIRRAALLLGLCAVLAAGLLESVRSWTQAPIAAARLASERQALALVLPSERHDNDPSQEQFLLHAPRWLGSSQPQPVRRARLRGQPSALVIEAVAPRGYAGPIRLLVAVAEDGQVLGTRVTEHQETPGLGDPIDARRSDWSEGFRGRSLGDPPLAGWTVRKQGGEFDQFAGATISPRAVVEAVRDVLRLLDRHHDALWQATPGTTLELNDGP